MFLIWQPYKLTLITKTYVLIQKNEMLFAFQESFSDCISVSFQSKTWSHSFLNSTHIESLWPFPINSTTAAFLFPSNYISMRVLPLLQISTPDGVREVDRCSLWFCFSSFMLDLTGGITIHFQPFSDTYSFYSKAQIPLIKLCFSYSFDLPLQKAESYAV